MDNSDIVHQIAALMKFVTHEALEAQKEFLLSKLEYIDGKLDLKTENILKSTELAAKSIDARLLTMNEFRGQIDDLTATLISRAEVMLLIKAVEERLSKIEIAMAEMKGKASQESVNRAYAFSIIAVAIGVIGILLKFV